MKMPIPSKLKLVFYPVITGICILFSLLNDQLRMWWLRLSILSEPYIWVLIIGFFLLFPVIGMNIPIPQESLKKLKAHLIIRGLQERKYYNVFINLPLTMIFEELFFRGVLFVLLLELHLFSILSVIFFSSFIFSIYHFHTWSSFKDKWITLLFIGISFPLGIACAIVTYYLGFIGAILLHWWVVIWIFVFWSKKIQKITSSK
jgi:hypothetical protein